MEELAFVPQTAEQDLTYKWDTANAFDAEKNSIELFLQEPPVLFVGGRAIRAPVRKKPTARLRELDTFIQSLDPMSGGFWIRGEFWPITTGEIRQKKPYQIEEELRKHKRLSLSRLRKTSSKRSLPPKK